MGLVRDAFSTPYSPQVGDGHTASRPWVSLGAHANGRRGTARVQSTAAYSFKGLSQIIKLAKGSALDIPCACA